MKSTIIKYSIFINTFLLILLGDSSFAQSNKKNSKKEINTSEFIFPFQDLHVHSSSIVELPNGDILSCWFEGSGERTANDVKVKGARLKNGESKWGETFVLADTPGHPDCNPTLFVDNDNRLFLFWIVVQANRWETSILKWKVSTDYEKSEIPKWKWQDIILLKPGEEFAETIKTKFKEADTPDMAWAEYAPLYERMIYEAANDQKKRETGWMTRTHPLQLSSGRILLPLYSDGYNMSMMAISDDNGKTWTPSLPIVGRGNIQPSVVMKADGTLVAYMRDNGDSPGRIMKSTSNDNGYEWSLSKATDLPNPGTSVEAIVLKNGEWAMVYNDVEDGRHSIAISLSDDEGESWKWTRNLEKRNKGEGSYSYPSLIQTKDGMVHVSYSFHEKDKKTIKYNVFSAEWIKE